jgi:cell division protease FtsH
MVMQLPEGDRYSVSYKWMVSRLAIMMGGRVAEEIKFGKDNITSGAASDIEQATKLARAMVTQWGFSDELGQVAYGENQQEVFLGHSVAQQKNVSEATSQKIDTEIRRLIDEAYAAARSVLTKKKKEWIAIAEGLLEYETLSGDEIKAIIEGRKPSRDLGDDTPPTRGSSVPKAGAQKKPKPRKTGEPDPGLEPQPQS